MILKNNKKLFYRWGLTIVAIFALLGYFLLVLDINLNSKYFVKRDFSNAFYARITGNCNEFGKHFIEEYANDWIERCFKEKRREDMVPIDKYKIKNISFGDDKAFLQVELTRTNISEGAYTYTINYEMERAEEKYLKIFPWTRYVISQELN